VHYDFSFVWFLDQELVSERWSSCSSIFFLFLGRRRSLKSLRLRQFSTDHDETWLDDTRRCSSSIYGARILIFVFGAPGVPPQRGPENWSSWNCMVSSKHPGLPHPNNFCASSRKSTQHALERVRWPWSRRDTRCRRLIFFRRRKFHSDRLSPQCCLVYSKFKPQMWELPTGYIWKSERRKDQWVALTRFYEKTIKPFRSCGTWRPRYRGLGILPLNVRGN